MRQLEYGHREREKEVAMHIQLLQRLAAGKVFRHSRELIICYLKMFLFEEINIVREKKKKTPEKMVGIRY